MSRKFFSLAATQYFVKQFPGGGRHEIVWSFVGINVDLPRLHRHLCIGVEYDREQGIWKRLETATVQGI